MDWKIVSLFFLFSSVLTASPRQCNATLLLFYGFNPIEEAVSAHLGEHQARGLFQLPAARPNLLRLTRVWNWLENDAHGLDELARSLSVATEEPDWVAGRVQDWKEKNGISDELASSMALVIKLRGETPILSRPLSLPELEGRIDSWLQGLSATDFEILAYWAIRNGVVNIDMTGVPKNDRHTAQRNVATSKGFREHLIKNGLIVRNLRVYFLHALNPGGELRREGRNVSVSFRGGVNTRTDPFSEESEKARVFLDAAGTSNGDRALFVKAWQTVAQERDPEISAKDLKVSLIRTVIAGLADEERAHRTEIEAQAAEYRKQVQALAPPQAEASGARIPSRPPPALPRLGRARPEAKPEPEAVKVPVSVDYDAQAAAMDRGERLKLFTRLAASPKLGERFLKDWEDIENTTQAHEFDRVERSLVEGLLILDADHRSTKVNGRHLRLVGKPGHKVWELKPGGRSQVRLFLGLTPEGFRIIRIADDVKGQHNDQHRIIYDSARDWANLGFKPN